jgi:hypothetical protein
MHAGTGSWNLQKARPKADLSHTSLKSIGDDSFFETVWERFKTKFSRTLTSLFPECLNGIERSKEMNDVDEKIEQCRTTSTSQTMGLQFLQFTSQHLIRALSKKRAQRFIESTNPWDLVQPYGFRLNMKTSKAYNNPYKKGLLQEVCESS